VSKSAINAKRRAALRQQMKRDQRKRLLHEAMEEVGDLVAVPSRGIDPAIAIQDVLDSLVALYRYATAKVAFLAEDEYFVDTIAGAVPSKWIREQERLGMQIVHVAAKAAGMGLAERAVRIQEAQAAMFAVVLEEALKQQKLDFDQRRAIMAGVAEGLDTIETRGIEALEKVA
jgi:homospermidine synthase